MRVVGFLVAFLVLAIIGGSEPVRASQVSSAPTHESRLRHSVAVHEKVSRGQIESHATAFFHNNDDDDDDDDDEVGLAAPGAGDEPDDAAPAQGPHTPAVKTPALHRTTTLGFESQRGPQNGHAWSDERPPRV